MDSKSPTLSAVLLLHLVLLLPFCANGSSTNIYVVYMGEKKHDDPSVVTASHHDILTSILGSKDEAHKRIVYSYKHGFSGFAAKLTEAQAEELKRHPGVVTVKPNTYHEVHTTRSWDFLSLNYYQPSELLKKAKYGEDVIVGVIDTGIWPESRSFDDTGYGPVPKRWKGVCQTGEKFNATSCNRKIIGARWYAGDASAEQLEGEYMSARDAKGHGTHTASTVAGAPVPGASDGGGSLAAGVARGGAPRARLAVYKACLGKCSDAALLAAFDDAINDGVDVLSASVGTLLEIPGTLHAVARGIPVVFSGGNNGPAQQTVLNAVPWVITVAASTMDRSFPTVITLADGEKLVGQSLYHNQSAAANSSAFETIVNGFGCDEDTLKAVNATGKIILCTPALTSNSTPEKVFVDAHSFAVKAGAKGIILAQHTTNNLDILHLCEGHMPCVVVDHEIAYRILRKSTMKVKISPATTVVGNGVIAPRVAAFSSRGPSFSFPAVLKPDIAAPGVSILAAKGDSYKLLSGTSMACPHVSAIVALLKSVHPDWSPAMIKSALVTTASVTDRFGMPIQAEGLQRKPADPFDFGGGHVDPDRAVDPGLVYDIDPKQYIKLFNCTLGPKEDCSEYKGNLYQLNLPSITIPNLKNSIIVWRTVTNCGQENATYRANVEAPMGVKMLVKPSTITFTNGGARNATFKVTFKSKMKVQGGYSFGSLTWLDDRKHSVRIPISVRTIVHDFFADVS